jgi:hypothetical protein
MYYVIRAFFQGNFWLLNLNGLLNTKFSGNDLMLQDIISPPDLYARAFSIDCLYQVDAPALKPLKGITDLEFLSNCSG